jgi:hypothetical protein
MSFEIQADFLILGNINSNLSVKARNSLYLRTDGRWGTTKPPPEQIFEKLVNKRYLYVSRTIVNSRDQPRPTEAPPPPPLLNMLPSV